VPTPVIIPLLNPNEPEALLAELYVQEGQHIDSGERICTLETTKSTAELVAEASGYIISLCCQAGQTLRAGDLLCTLAESPHWRPPEAPVRGAQISQAGVIPPGLRISQPALALARQLGIPLEGLPTSQFITEGIVRSLAGGDHTPSGVVAAEMVAHESLFDPTGIVVYGGGGHGKTVIEMLRTLGSYRVAAVVDDGIPAGDTILDVPVLGGWEALSDLYNRGVRLAANAVGGIGNLSIRIQVFQRLAQAGFGCPALVHPRAFVESSAELSAGVHVFPFAYVGSDCRLGYGSIANTGAIISHDCSLGNYTNISPGAILAGGVTVGEGTLIGMGATINLLVRVGAGARIGNGATVKSDVPDGTVVRAGSIYPG
jgi:sugar O-acyltransferase (sialic acid O-acetyltransferase NeuD family)